MPTGKAVTGYILSQCSVALTRVRPSALRDVQMELPRVQWSDIGGQARVKARLREVLEWPLKHPDLLQRMGVRPSQGVLLYGPPGCSKTLLARAAASEVGLNFFAVQGGELYSKFVGESEKAIQRLFHQARAVAPSLVFFDELDGLAGRRDDQGRGEDTTTRVITQLLQELDGAQARGHVVILAASNRPQALDPALLRPGRFDTMLYVGPPDGPERADILAVQLRGVPLAAEVDLEALATRCSGFSGADLAALCREAKYQALEEDLESSQLTAAHFEAALNVVHPSLRMTAAEEEAFQAFQPNGGVARARLG